MARLNNNQQKAVEARNKNILVSASAGTGKTTVLIERLMRLITEEHKSIDQFLVMSFTTAAAQEIKDRLSAKINEILETQPENADFLYEQLAKVPLADISTIDAYCLNIVKKYGYILNINPDAIGNVMDDSDTTILQSRAMDMTFANILEYNDLVASLCPRSESLSQITDTIQEISNMMDGLEDPHSWADNVEDNYDALEQGEFTPAISKAVKEYGLYHYNSLIYVWDELNYIFTDISEKITTSFNKMAETVNEGLRNIRYGLENEEYQNIDAICNDILQLRFPALRGADDDTKNLATELKKRFKEGMTALTLVSPEKFKASAVNTHRYISQLMELTFAYRTNFQQLKQEAELIDFNDMETMAIEVLKANNGEIADIYRKRYYEIMVDEYQDSAEKQEKLVSLISNGHNVFRVGDVKQSIYGFRNAKPELMISLMNNLTENDIRLSLNQNYRSKENIIIFSNAIFEKLMNLNGHRAFDDDDALRIGIDAQKQDNLPIKINLLKTAAAKAPKRERDILLARHIAHEIIKLHDNNGVGYDKICILLRGNAPKAILKDVFAQASIPCYAVYKEGFYQDEAVSSVLGVLTLICNRNNDYSIINVLRGPIFRENEDYLAELYIKYPEDSFWDRIVKDEHPLSSLINDLSDYMKDHTLSSLVSRLYAYDNWYLEKTSLSQRDNLDYLFQMTVAFQKDDNSLAALIQYFNNQKQEDRQDAVSIAKSDELVQIMTIHQSKGLEFEYVFLADFSIGIRSRTASSCIISDTLGATMHYVSLPYRIKYDNPLVKIINHHNHLSDIEEELRLLYVAVTRAKKQLTIVHVPQREVNEPLSINYLSNGNTTYTLWILNALDSCQKDIRDLVQVNTVNEGDITYHSEKKNVQHFTPIQFYSNKLYEEVSQDLTPSASEESRLPALDYNVKPGAARGIQMHKAVELSGIKEMNRNDIIALNLDLSNTDISKLLNFYRDPLTVQLRQYDTYHEWPYIANTGNGISNGVIDLFAIKGQDIILVDFKSDRNVDETTLFMRYEKQIGSYYQTLRKAYPNHSIKAYIYSFTLNTYILIRK